MHLVDRRYNGLMTCFIVGHGRGSSLLPGALAGDLGGHESPLMHLVDRRYNGLMTCFIVGHGRGSSLLPGASADDLAGHESPLMHLVWEVSKVSLWKQQFLFWQRGIMVHVLIYSSHLST